jgi:hypothetical protein
LLLLSATGTSSGRGAVALGKKLETMRTCCSEKGAEEAEAEVAVDVEEGGEAPPRRWNTYMNPRIPWLNPKWLGMCLGKSTAHAKRSWYIGAS